MKTSGRRSFHEKFAAKNADGVINSQTILDETCEEMLRVFGRSYGTRAKYESK